jgi:very-short-patch-repair endonuclease
MSASAVSSAVNDGTWQKLLPGVFTDAGHVPDAVQWAWAAVLSSGGEALACTRTAARLWALPLIDDADPTTGAADDRFHDVAVARNVRTLGNASASEPVLVRRQLALTADDVVRHDCGVLVTTPRRTLRDLAAALSHEALVCAMDDGLRRSLVTEEALEQELALAKGGRHAAGLRRAVDVADGGAATPAETLARLLLRPLLPGLRCQVPVTEPWGELVAILDLADEELMLAIEVDGKRGHAGQQMVAKDRRRDRRIAALGWHTERVTWAELRLQPWAVVAHRGRHRAAPQGETAPPSMINRTCRRDTPGVSQRDVLMIMEKALVRRAVGPTARATACGR